MVEVDGEPDDLALIDVVHLVNDTTGNRLPYDPANIRHVVLARAEPAAVGISPIGGLLHPTGADDDRGVEVLCVAAKDVSPGAGERLLVPISPGLYCEIGVTRSRELALGQEVVIEGPGLLAFDGDRERPLAAGQPARARVERLGPRVIDVGQTLALAAERGTYRNRREWHDARGSASVSCC